ncbi:MAG: MBL fold metallo-hydrolase, partial [Pseudomonadota bacterium]
MKRKLGIAIVLVAAIGVGLVFGFQRAIGQAVFERVGVERIAGNRLTLDDGLHIILCGTGSPLPNPDRAGPCNVIVAGDQAFVVDIGEGGARNLNLMGFDVAGIDGLFITHYHSDHIDGVGPLALLRWTQGTATTPLPLYGPQGLEQVVDGFNAVYGLDHGYRVDHHSDAIVPESGGGLTARMFEMGNEPQVVFDSDGLTVTAFRVTHDPID